MSHGGPWIVYGSINLKKKIMKPTFPKGTRMQNIEVEIQKKKNLVQPTVQVFSGVPLAMFTLWNDMLHLHFLL